MASLEINNLGKFADMSQVWSTHPEGGREGDFLTIGQTKFRWNVYKRSWVPVGETTPGGSASETIDGDLTVGGDLHVGGDAEIEGDVTIGGELHLPNGDRYKGQSSYKSIVFTRSDERPDPPSGGLYSNPLPDGNAWKDGIPAGTKPIWMSSRVFTSDGKAPATSSWSTPALMSDAENFDVEFSPARTDTVPPAPVGGVNGNLGWLWFDPVRNPNADWDRMNWMATRSQSQGVWSDWTIMLIKGETGDGVQSVFTVTDGSIPSISGSAYPPSGWSKSVDSLTVNQGDVLWMSERRFEAGAWSAWSAPVRLNGIDGLAGEDGSDIEFIYKRMNRLPNTGGNTDNAPSNQRDQDGYVPTAEGWEDHPSGVDANAKYEWACQRTKGGDSTLWSEWIGPFVWSAFGERGMDGDGVEYVFIRTTVFSQPTITEAAVQEAEQYPEVANHASYGTGEIDGNTFFDDPKGVNSTWLYEWVSKRKKVAGVWGAFSAPALWATYSEEHTIDIDETTGCWIIDGRLTDKKAVGNGVAVKGKVDYYSRASQGWTSGKSTLEDITSPSIGDSYVVGADGHLYLCVATSGTLAAMWQDLGEFKGEPGQSQYMHIAWASKINFTGNPQVFASAEDFTKDYVAGRNYDWMGVCVNKYESDTNPDLSAGDYKWNYLKGKDGNDIEYVYLRTKVNTAPTITEAAVQTPERYPEVANYNNSYAAGDAEYDHFTDDPSGVNSTYKYEWVSRREKSYNPNTGKMEWGTFLSPARLWAKWGDPGQPGESQPSVATDVTQVVIDADAAGQIASPRTVTVKCWLMLGKEKQMPNLNALSSAYYGGQYINISNQTPSASDPYVTVSVTLPANTPLVTKDIKVTLGNSQCSASTTVPVIINKAGAEGRDVYKSIVFMRSYTKPTTPGDNDGGYSSPVPSATHTDSDNAVCSWDDGVEAGTKPVWMTSRIFSSDNQTPPQEAHWNPVVLMQDEPNTYDVEFTDASLDNSPGTPDNPATGVTWYDPVDDASYLSSHAMNWMAQRVKVVTANGTGWSNWVVNRIRGEKGNDGNGIDRMVTYYLVTTKFTGVTTSDTGWVDHFVEPTAELPYLWRFTRYTYTTNGSTPYDTPCELVKTYYTDGNPNLLGDALFIADSMGAWDKKGVLSSRVEVADNFTPVFATSSSFNAQTNGHRQFRGTFKAKSTDGYITLLSQFVNKDTGLSKVEASQWYTLSFLLYGTRDDQTDADFILAADVSQIADSNENVFIDGQERDASNAYKNFTVTDTFTRHTMTFKAKSSLSGDLSVVWYMHPRTYTQNVYISEPKLELGKVATQFSAAPFIDKPMTRTSTWQEGMDYQAGQQGEKYLDIVDYNGGWYRCQKSHISTNANKPDEAQQYTEYWFKANRFELIATNLLLADNAAINLLSSNVINLFNGVVRTASINADGHGSYCIYYPNGRKRYEMSYSGYNIYYNDDEGNTEAWRIGNDGNIVKKVEYWSSIWLYKFQGEPANNSFNGHATFERVRYPRYFNSSSSSSWNGKIFAANESASGSPAGKTVIADGYYTEQPEPILDQSSMESNGWYIQVYHIVNGVIDDILTKTTNMP